MTARICKKMSKKDSEPEEFRPSCDFDFLEGPAPTSEPEIH